MGYKPDAAKMFEAGIMEQYGLYVVLEVRTGQKSCDVMNVWFDTCH